MVHMTTPLCTGKKKQSFDHWYMLNVHKLYIHWYRPKSVRFFTHTFTWCRYKDTPDISSIICLILILPVPLVLMFVIFSFSIIWYYEERLFSRSWTDVFARALARGNDMQRKMQDKRTFLLCIGFHSRTSLTSCSSFFAEKKAKECLGHRFSNVNPQISVMVVFELSPAYSASLPASPLPFIVWKIAWYDRMPSLWSTINRYILAN